jgi:hypothetical protein
MLPLASQHRLHYFRSASARTSLIHHRHSVVACMIFSTVCTRSYKSFILLLLSQRMSLPSIVHQAVNMKSLIPSIRTESHHLSRLMCLMDTDQRPTEPAVAVIRILAKAMVDPGSTHVAPTAGRGSHSQHTSSSAGSGEGADDGNEGGSRRGQHTERVLDNFEPQGDGPTAIQIPCFIKGCLGRDAHFRSCESSIWIYLMHNITSTD